MPYWITPGKRRKGMRVEICCVGLCKMGVHQNSSSSVLDTLSSSNTHEPYQKTEITKHSGEQKAVSIPQR